MTNVADAAQTRHRDGSTSRKDALGSRKPLRFMGLSIQRHTSAEMVAAVCQSVQTRQPLNIAFCNANTLLLAHDDSGYHDTLSTMTLVNDGIGAELAARILDGEPFPENLNGTDFVPHLLEHADRPLRVFLLGAKPEIVEMAGDAWAKRFPRHDFSGRQHGYFDRADTNKVIAAINEARPDVLLVAMGNPKQEQFIMEHREALEVPVAMGIGALFDFTAQVVPRAPMWMRRAKIEWLYRLLQEPSRLLHRYTIGIGRFLWLCVKLRIKGGNA